MPWRNRAASVTLCLSLVISAVFAVKLTANAATLSDIAGHWAAADITALVDAGVIKGYDDGSFRPDNAVTRAEFVTLINRAAGVTPATYNHSFKDVGTGDWYAGDVAAAVAAGYIKGYSDGTFGPNKNITRSEVAVALTRAMVLHPATSLKAFTDAAQIPAWAADSVEAASESGYVKGYSDGSFGGTRNLTRAEAATLVARARARLVDYLAKPQVNLAVQGSQTATTNRPTTLTYTISNEGAAASENVFLVLNVTREEGPITDGSHITTSYNDDLPPNTTGPGGSTSLHPQWSETTPDHLVLQAGPDVYAGNGKRGYQLPGKASHWIGASVSYPDTGTYDIVAQVQGVSGQNLGQPVEFRLTVSEIYPYFGTPAGQVAGLAASGDTQMVNESNKDFGENVIPVLVLSRPDGNLSAADLSVSYYGPDDHMVKPSEVTYDAVSKTFRAPIGLPGGYKIPANAYVKGPNALITVRSPGDADISLVLVGAQSGKVFGEPTHETVTFMTMPTTQTATTSLAGNMVTVQGAPVMGTINYGSGSDAMLSEGGKIRIYVSAPGVTPDAISMQARDFQYGWATVRFSQNGPDEIVGEWTQSHMPNGMPVTYRTPEDIQLTANPGHYTLRTEVVGGQSGKVYGSGDAHTLDVASLQMAVSQGSVLPDGVTTPYTVKLTNPGGALSENALIAIRVGLRQSDPQALSNYGLSYLDPNVGQWKTVELAKVSDGDRDTLIGIVAAPAGIPVTAHGDATIQLQVIQPKSSNLWYVDGEALGATSGQWFGNTGSGKMELPMTRK